MSHNMLMACKRAYPPGAFARSLSATCPPETGLAEAQSIGK